MSGRRAKAIRQTVYGPDQSPRARQYRYARPFGVSQDGKPETHTTVLAGATRLLYQHAKRRWLTCTPI